MENTDKKPVTIVLCNKYDIPISEELYQKAQFLVKYGSLSMLTLQNAALNLTMRLVRTQRELFISSTAVVMAEIIKLITCVVAIGYIDEGNVMRFPHAFKKHVIHQPYETLKVAVPSLLYLLQNNLLYLGATHLDAATCQVTYQLKILTTALFSVAMLNKRLNMHQWIALVTLFLGIALVQVAQMSATEANPDTMHQQRPLLGLLAIVAACCLSGFAGVYFEKILKGGEVSLWMRNVQLCLSSIPLGLGTVLFMDWTEVSSKGFFHGYNELVWFVIFLQALGGLVVAIVVKYADNILKGFSTSIAIVVTSVISAYLLNFQVTRQFVVGASLVIGSTFLYSHPQKQSLKSDKI